MTTESHYHKLVIDGEEGTELYHAHPIVLEGHTHDIITGKAYVKGERPI